MAGVVNIYKGGEIGGHRKTQENSAKGRIIWLSKGGVCINGPVTWLNKVYNGVGVIVNREAVNIVGLFGEGGG